ncbi:hypothetical protein JHK85_035694 [Glycine max]|nr:hypothetical protein JHK85_035694 [Glycine max]
MANLSSPGFNLFLVSLLVTLVQIQTKVQCYQYKVGDLDSWGIPISPSSHLYDKWSKYHNLRTGDSLPESYKSCNLKDPILYMNNGNSLFNITSEGDFYFTSGEAGHCQKNQKLHITVGVGGNTNALAPTSLPENATSYPTVFGNIPMAPSSSRSTSSSPHRTSKFSLLIIGFFLCALLSSLM